MTNFGFRVVIPARFASTRFPGKVLANIAGRSMLEHVYGSAQASGAEQVCIATDDERVARVARGFGAEVVMTHDGHESGTDRAAEVASIEGWSRDTLVVNLQGDAPCTPPASIRQVAQLLADSPGAAIATLCVPIAQLEDYLDSHVVKVVSDQAGRALYFSRSPIPAVSHGSREFPGDARRHLGIYAYRVGALRTLTDTPPCYLERTEKLEQLRALWLGMEVRVGMAKEAHGPDVDTPEDLDKAIAFLAGQ